MSFGINFAPRGWALCDGSLLAISTNQALFSLLGTQYGGDGRTSFGLPDLRSRVAIGIGNGAGLSNRVIGQRLGTETNTVQINNLPSHTHSLIASTDVGALSDPTGNFFAGRAVEIDPGTVKNSKPFIESTGTPAVNMSAGSIGNTGGGGSEHTNVQPFTTCLYAIALFGIFPSRV